MRVFTDSRGLGDRAAAAGLALLLVLAAGHVWARAYPGSDAVIGSVERYAVGPTDSLIEIARRFDLGYLEAVRANPGVDPFAPPIGAEVVVPNMWIVPEAARSADGITINLSELRLYFTFHSQGTRLLATFPVGIGREGWETPLGRFRVVGKVEHPVWYVPQSLRRERPDLPAFVPPGPENPLGSCALLLSEQSILIHGTSRPWGVGRRVSHGCIRLYPEDISRLYDLVPVGTAVTVVREPIKVGEWGGRVFVSAQEDASAGPDPLASALRLIADQGLSGRVDQRKLRAVLAEKLGFPVDVSP